MCSKPVRDEEASVITEAIRRLIEAGLKSAPDTVGGAREI
jgi:hypothetical protein